MFSQTIRNKPLLATLAAAAAVFALVFQIVQAPPAQASYSGGKLIDDAVFLNAKTMSATSIQNFLEDMGSGLATKKYKLYCDNEQTTESYEAVGGDCDKLISASRIIYYAAQSYGINPRVILATLQKEQSLITTPDPTAWQLSQAMGYACPTSGSCSSSSNFSYQIDYGTWGLRKHRERANGNNNWWSPTTKSWVCGTSKKYYKPNLYPGQNVRFYDGNDVHYRTHYISNPATSSLYCYTPHAYNNPKGLYGLPKYGTKGQYYTGSYNFVKNFQRWFGSTNSNVVFKSMKTPRWMELKQSTKKLDPYTKDQLDSTLEAGQQIYFDEIIVVSGETYLRTKHDSGAEVDKAIPIDLLKEVSLDYTSLKFPRWMKTTASLHKINPRTNQPTKSVIPAGTLLYFPTLTKINNTLYLRTQADTQNGMSTGIQFNLLDDANIDYKTLAMPRWMISTRNTQLYDLRYPGGSTSPIITTGAQLFFNYKTSINGHVYVTEDQPATDEYPGINLDYLRNISSSDFGSMKYQKAYKLTETLRKTDLVTGLPTGSSIAVNEPVYFQTLIELGGDLYLRTAYDTTHGGTAVIPLVKVSPIDVTFNSMLMPRRLKLKTDTWKVDPVTLQRLDGSLDKSQSIAFSQSISIDGKLYLRTAYDTGHGHFKVIPFSVLKEL